MNHFAWKVKSQVSRIIYGTDVTDIDVQLSLLNVNYYFDIESSFSFFRALFDAMDSIIFQYSNFVFISLSFT